MGYTPSNTGTNGSPFLLDDVTNPMLSASTFTILFYLFTYVMLDGLLVFLFYAITYDALGIIVYDVVVTIGTVGKVGVILTVGAIGKVGAMVTAAGEVVV